MVTHEKIVYLSLYDDEGLEYVKSTALSTKKKPYDNVDITLNDTELLISESLKKSLKRINPYKYDPGQVDFRRQCKLFTDLYFNLGCLVSPTKNELEMLNELIKMSDSVKVREFENSLYQSCIMRSKAFHETWRLFCVSVFNILQKHIRNGINTIIKLLGYSRTIESFLQVILINAGINDRDKNYLLNLFVNEFERYSDGSFLLVKINTYTAIKSILEDLTSQMYTNMKREGKLKNGNNTKVGVIDEFLQVYNKFYRNSTLVIVFNKLVQNINEIFYTFLTFKRDANVNAVFILPTTCWATHIESYCTTTVYQQLAIFNCDVIPINTICDEFLKILLWNSDIQTFIPNLFTIEDIWNIFYDIDMSVYTLLTRIYNLYETYYFNHQFSFVNMPSLLDNDGRTNGLVGIEVKGVDSDDSGVISGDASEVNKEDGEGQYTIESRRSEVDVSVGGAIGDNTNLDVPSALYTPRNVANMVRKDISTKLVSSMNENIDCTDATIPDSDTYNHGLELYSKFVLLAIGAGLSDSHVAYLELKLGTELTRSRVIYEIIPLNSAILFERRLSYQLGVELLYNLLDFLPDCQTARKKLRVIVEGFLGKNADNRINVLIKRIMNVIVTKGDQRLEQLRSVLNDFNARFKRLYPIIKSIQKFLNTYDGDDLLLHFENILTKNTISSVKFVERLLLSLFFPLIGDNKLATDLMLQRCLNNSRNLSFLDKLEKFKGKNNNAFVNDIIRLVNTAFVLPGKSINMWDLFCLYYTTLNSDDPLAVIFIRFTIALETLTQILGFFNVSFKQDHETATDNITLAHLIKSKTKNIGIKRVYLGKA